jgi:hypothetical protein
MKDDIPNPLSEVLHHENVTMPKAKKVKVNWFKSYQKINSEINQSGPNQETTRVMPGTSCSVPESGTSSEGSDDVPACGTSSEIGTSPETGMSSEDSDIIITFDAKAEKMRQAEQEVINIESDDSDDISVCHVGNFNSERQKDAGTVLSSADSGPVADIWYEDDQNTNFSERSANDIPADPINIYRHEGTSNTIPYSCKHTGRYVFG